MALEIMDENAEKFAFQQDVSLYRILTVNLMVCYQGLGYHFWKYRLCNKLLKRMVNGFKQALKSFFYRTRRTREGIFLNDDDDVKLCRELNLVLLS